MGLAYSQENPTVEWPICTEYESTTSNFLESENCWLLSTDIDSSICACEYPGIYAIQEGTYTPDEHLDWNRINPPLDWNSLMEPSKFVPLWLYFVVSVCAVALWLIPRNQKHLPMFARDEPLPIEKNKENSHRLNAYENDLLSKKTLIYDDSTLSNCSKCSRYWKLEMNNYHFVLWFKNSDEGNMIGVFERILCIFVYTLTLMFLVAFFYSSEQETRLIDLVFAFFVAFLVVLVIRLLVTSIQWIRPPGFPKERLEKIKNESWKDLAKDRDWKENFSDEEYGESDIEMWSTHRAKDVQETSFIESQ